MRSYELMTIYRPELAEADVRTMVTETEQSLVQAGATPTSTEFWGKRRFAYEIDHLREGYYAVIAFEAEPGATAGVDRSLDLADAVVRHKFIRTDDDGGDVTAG